MPLKIHHTDTIYKLYRPTELAYRYPLDMYDSINGFVTIVAERFIKGEMVQFKIKASIRFLNLEKPNSLEYVSQEVELMAKRYMRRK